MNKKKERLDNATNYLLDLLRAYGKRPITVKITQSGEEVDAIAGTFVKQHLARMGFSFPHEEGAKPNTRKVNDSLDQDMLSVIFHEALFEFMVAYVKARCEGNPNAAHFLDIVYNWVGNRQQWLNCTFPLYTDDELIAFPETPAEAMRIDAPEVDAATLKKNVAFLNEMGYEQIANQTEMMQLFWELAMRSIVMDTNMRAAIKTITIEEQALRYFSNSYRAYNRTLQKYPQKAVAAGEILKQPGKAMPTASSGKIEAETNQRIHAVKKELNEKIRKIRQDGSTFKKTARMLKKMLDDPASRFQKTYDLTNEDDIESYLLWYRMMKRVVRSSTVKAIEKFRYPEAGALDLFKQKVEALNAEIRSMEDYAGEEDSEE